MKKYKPYIFIVVAIILPILYHLINYDDRGGLPTYKRGLLIVNLISYAIFLTISISAIKELYTESNSSIKNTRNIFNAFAKLIIIVIIILLPNTTSSTNRYSWKQEDLDKIIDVKIEGRNYMIPIKYLDSSWKTGQEISHLGLVALLPEFEWRSLKNKNKFKAYKNGIGERIKMFLDVKKNPNKIFRGKFGDLTNKSLYLQYYKNEFKVTNNSNPISTKYGLNHIADLRKRELYISTKENNNIYYRCYKDPEPGKRYFPTCETQFPLWGNVVMKYSFSKRYLKNWESIHEGVIKLVVNFEEQV